LVRRAAQDIRMGERVERGVLERQRCTVRRDDVTALGQTVGGGAFERNAKGGEREVCDNNVAAGSRRKIQTRPPGPGPYVQELRGRAEFEQLGDSLGFLPRRPTGTAIRATANATFQVAHRGRAMQLGILRIPACQLVQFQGQRHDVMRRGTAGRPWTPLSGCLVDSRSSPCGSPYAVLSATSDALLTPNFRLADCALSEMNRYAGLSRTVRMRKPASSIADR